MTFDPTKLPDGLPVPADDGAADHLPGMAVPPVSLLSSQGGEARLDTLSRQSRLVVYAYPLTGLPGVESPPGWEEVPGARGCTPESCGFRDHAAELAETGAAVVGLSTQTTAYQQEAARRLRLPFPLLSDSELALTEAMRLPVFTTEVTAAHDGGGHKTLLKRLTLVLRDGVVEEVFYPVFPPDTHAADVLAWLRAA